MSDAGGHNDTLHQFLLSLFEHGKGPSSPKGCLADLCQDTTNPIRREFLIDPDVQQVATKFITVISQHWKRIEQVNQAAERIETEQIRDSNTESVLVSHGDASPASPATPEISHEISRKGTEVSNEAPNAEPQSAPLRHDMRPGVPPSLTTTRGVPVNPVASFKLQNGRVNERYSSKIAGSLGDGREIKILEVKGSEEVGLEFQVESGELTGSPIKDGDFPLHIRWSCEPGVTHDGIAHLIINPDPRTLWKCIEPPKNAPYQKPNADATTLIGTQKRIAVASRRGRSHEHAGLFRDDDFFALPDTESGWTVLIVADGAGGAQYSREGSRLAVSAAGKSLSANLAGDIGKSLVETLNKWDEEPESRQLLGEKFHFLFHEASKTAVQAIETEAAAVNAKPRDYSTTLLAAVIRECDENTFVATFWLGDGAIATYGPKGNVRLMGNPDGGEFAGQTRFLDRAAVMDASFSKRTRIGRFKDITAVILLTDGVSDPFFETDSGLADAGKWNFLWDQISPALAGTDPGAALLDWLSFFVPGHHDDRTIAVYW